MSKDIDKPNVVLPLAASYNQRSGLSFGTTSTDQVKINSQYEPITNSMTGTQTLYLTKRRGFQLLAGAVGSAGDVPYLAIPDPTVTAASPWTACISTNTLRVKDIAGTATNISTAANLFPVYFDRTMISGTQHAVLQTYNSAASKYQTWYASTLATWFEVSSANFPANPIGKMEHIDGYAFQMTSTNRIHGSDLNSLAAWSAANFITKSIEQDSARGLARYKNMLLAFGAESVEAYYNAGYATGSPLERIPQLSAKVGLRLSLNDTSPIDPVVTLGHRHYYASLGDKLYFTGREGGLGYANWGIYAFDGQRFYKISTPNIERLFTNGTPLHVGVLNMIGQQAVCFATGGPSATPQTWAMYFPKWNEWFQWNSIVFQPVSDGRAALGIGGTGTSNSYFIDNPVGSWVDWTASTYQFQHTFTLPTSGQYQQMRMAGVVGDTARSAQSLGVEFSDDDYQTWRTADSIDMTTDKKRIYRQGGFRERAIRLTYTGALDIRLQKFVAKIV